MLWLLTTTETWTEANPDIGYTVRLCEGETPYDVGNVKELLKQEQGLQLCRLFQTVDEAERFVSEKQLRLLSPIPRSE